jgi:cytochrome oxidase Cu insertion factor (SCO1/SenC/PrrC family)
MAKTYMLLLLGACLVATASAQNSSPHDLDRVKPGQQPPDFTLPTHDGRTISLSGLRGKNVVLVFYRGYW